MSVNIFASRFLSYFYLIPYLYGKIPDYYAGIFLFVFLCDSKIRGRVPGDFLRSIDNDSARVGKGLGKGHIGGVKIARVCTKNYYGLQFIVIS